MTNHYILYDINCVQIIISVLRNFRIDYTVFSDGIHTHLLKSLNAFCLRKLKTELLMNKLDRSCHWLLEVIRNRNLPAVWSIFCESCLDRENLEAHISHIACEDGYSKQEVIKYRS